MWSLHTASVPTPPSLLVLCFKGQGPTNFLDTNVVKKSSAGDQNFTCGLQWATNTTMTNHDFRESN